MLYDSSHLKYIKDSDSRNKVKYDCQRQKGEEKENCKMKNSRDPLGNKNKLSTTYLST